MTPTAGGAGANHADPSNNHPIDTNNTTPQAISADSRSVDWWSVYTWVRQLLADVGDYPAAGTPAWRALDDDDPRRLYGILLAGVHHVLRVDTAQEARAAASRDISAAADWAAVSREMRRYNDFHATHPWAKRVAS